MIIIGRKHENKLPVLKVRAVIVDGVLYSTQNQLAWMNHGPHGNRIVSLIVSMGCVAVEVDATPFWSNYKLSAWMK
jgi:hypothetical protein